MTPAVGAEGRQVVTFRTWLVAGNYSVATGATSCAACPQNMSSVTLGGTQCTCNAGYSEVNDNEATAGDDSCEYANDGECDEPQDCTAGTDTSDCSSTSGSSPPDEGKRLKCVACEQGEKQ